MLAIRACLVLGIGIVLTMSAPDRTCDGIPSDCCYVQEGVVIKDLRAESCRLYREHQGLVKTRSSNCNDPNKLTFHNNGCEAMCTFLPWNNYGCLDTQHRNAWLYCRNGSSVYDTSNGACDKRRGDLCVIG